jgi:hypothetical protein
LPEKNNDKEKSKKQVLLRLSPSLWNELAAWAEDDLRTDRIPADGMCEKEKETERRIKRQSAEAVYVTSVLCLSFVL